VHKIGVDESTANKTVILIVSTYGIGMKN